MSKFKVRVQQALYRYHWFTVEADNEATAEVEARTAAGDHDWSSDKLDEVGYEVMYFIELDPKYEWQREVANDDTVLGYAEWAAHREEQRTHVANSEIDP